jgi:DNA (cytosine-5)-methyltransferase 1
VRGLILSLFPGLGLLDLGFIEQGWTVVRGPDIIYGSLHDIRDFHPPAGVFEGIIGGPPCQAHSRLAAVVRHRFGRVAPDLIPEFARCVEEAQPEWFLMENVPSAPDPRIEGYAVHAFLLNNRWLVNSTPQNRLRKIWFGVKGKQKVDLRRWIEYTALEAVEYEGAVLVNGQFRERRLSKKINKSMALVRKSLKLQGLPEDFFDPTPLTVEGKQLLLGNAVPLAMSRALAKAIRLYLNGGGNGQNALAGLSCGARRGCRESAGAV